MECFLSILMPGLIIIFSKNKKLDKGLLSAMADSLQHEEFHKKTVFSAPPFGVARVHLRNAGKKTQEIRVTTSYS